MADKTAQRLSRLETRRAKVKKKMLDRKSPFLPGEDSFRKQIAVVLRVAGYEYEYIGDCIGRGTTTVHRWFSDDPDVKELYQTTIDHLAEGALTLLRSYTIEAVQTIVEIMRNSGDPKVTLDAAKEILDRGGISKISRSEAHTVSESKTTLYDDKFVETLRQLPPEYAEEAAQAIEKLQSVVNKHGDSEKN